IDLEAHVLISPLPDTINLCIQNSGDALVTSTDPIMTPCKQAQPFDDQSLTAAPIVFNWDASTSFSTTASARIHLDEGTPLDPTDDLSAGGRIQIDHIPSKLNATVAVPASGQTGPIRVRTTGPAGSNIDVSLHGDMTRGGADCNDPNPAHDVACGDVTIDNLPTNTSMLFDPTKNASRAEFHACDYRFYAPTPACKPGTAGAISSLLVDGHLVKGQPGGSLGVLEPTTDQYAFLQYKQTSPDDLALRVRARFEQIRNVFYKQTADGWDAGYDMGSGTKPFEAKVQADTRTGVLPDADGIKAAAELLISPLPAQINVGMHGPGDGTNAAPMKLNYDASSPIRVQAHAQVFRAAAGNNPSCGDDGTACATLDIQRIPAHMLVTVGQNEVPAVGGGIDHHTVVDFVSDAPIGLKPDVTVDAIVGLPSDTPVVGSVPIRAFAQLLGLPRYLTVNMDEHVTNPGATNEQRDLQKVSIRTCQVNVSDACVAGTEDALDTLDIRVQNFLVRPTNFPAPNHDINQPLWATIVGRGKQFQAAVHLTNIREATYVNHQGQAAKGFRVKVGSNQNLQAIVDIKGLPLGNINFGDEAIQDATLDAHASVLISPLPNDISICMRESGRDVNAPSGDVITAPCEDTAPFGPSVGTVDHTPMSVAYRASVPIQHINTTIDVALNGKEANTPGHPAIQARKLHGELNIDNIPTAITAHILTPASDADGNATGPTRVVYDAPSTGPGINVHFRAEETVGNSVCQDPRPSATALCVGADLSDLPKHVELRYEPDLLSNNFHAATSSDFNSKMNFTNLELSSVKPKLDGSGNPIPGKADVLVFTGQILGIDDNITVDGNINMPHNPNKAGSIDLTASVRIDEIDATVRNYVAPDPFTAAIPARPVYKDPTSPSNLSTFTVRARPLPDGSPVFKAEVAVKNIAGFGFHQISDSTGAPTGTAVINVDFAKDFAARAYADVVLADGTHITGDVLLEHIPAGLQFCFRGSRPASTPAPASGQPNVWCDDTTDTNPEDGAFQFLGTPANPGLTGMDVDAFVRMAAPGGTDIVSGRLNITGIPYRIDGILPSQDNGGRLDIAGKDFSGNPLGIKQIKFHAASFDMQSGSGDLQSGYTSATPGFVPILNQSDPFPVTTATTQFTSVAANGDPSGPFDFEAAGRLGDANNAVSSSRLQRIYSSSTACSNRGSRPDFPMFPTNDNVSTYRCIGLDLQQTNPSVPDPFALSAIYKAADGKIVRLRNAGINDLPAYFQVNLAKTALIQGSNDALRRRCGSAAAETTAYNAAHGTSKTQAEAAALITDCMPPLIRFDQPLASARLFGVAEFGTPADLQTLADLQPKEALADLDAIPRGDGWGAVTGDTATEKGIRAKAITTGARTAARVSFRLPVPQSVTVDQVQSASSHGEADQAHYFDASDLRFHYVVRDGAGNTVGNLGELSALYQGADGSQVLLGAPCQLNPRQRVTNNSFGTFSINTPYNCNPDYRHGLLIPGEIGISMYTRNNLGTGKKYIQIDGRLSTDESAAVRMIGNDPTGAGRIEAEIKNVPGPLDKNGNPDSNIGPDDATFRIAFLSKGDPQTPPTATPPTPPTPPSACVLCVTSNIRLAQAFVSFNFWPDTSKPKARLVEATLNRAGTTKNGLELHSYNEIKGGSNAAVQAQAYLQVDPLNISFYLNLAPTLEALGQQMVDWVVNALDLPDWVSDILSVVTNAIADLLASLVNLDATLTSRLDATVDVRTSHLTLRENLLHVKVKNMGAVSDGTGNATIGPIDWYVQELKANANLGITIHTPWPFPDINLGLTLLTVYYVPVAYNIVPFLFKYLNCSGNFWDLASDIVPPLPGDTITAGPGGTKDVVIWPLYEPRLQLGGLIGGLINTNFILRSLGGLFFCIPGADDSDIPLGPPGDTFDTVSGGLWPDHPIFNSDAMADSVLTAGAPGGIGGPPADPPAPVDCTALPTPAGCPPPPAPPANGPNYTRFAGAPLALCGIHAFGDLTVNSSATIEVATAADATNTTGTGANCAAASVGKLIITADTITNHGTIDGSGTQATQPSVGNPAVATTSATGNSGAGHGGAGGAGSNGAAGPAYSLTGNANSEKNQATSEVGAPGSAITGSRPNGGGLIQLFANDSIVSDGAITADGDNGIANITGACAFDTVVNNVPGPGTHIVHTGNTGVAAPAGAGSGGGIVLSAPVVDVRGTTGSELHANGGAGANSRKGSSGGGGGGVVKLIAPILRYDAGFAPGVSGGAAGTNLCAGLDVPAPESSAGSPGSSGVVIKVATPVAQAAATTAFWNNGSSITVPFSAKAAYQTAGIYDVVLCGLHTATTTAPSGGVLADLFTVPLSNTVSTPCGSGASVLATKHISAGNSQIDFGDALASVTFSLTGAGNNG
ncbi:MAG: hypothetical protein QOJ34_3015, partial [Pseudonocardiales bacterium]|nr:hypothetical protein [Pseudonocardiales bacterium]